MEGKKILVAEDEPNILRSLRLVLEEAGYHVLTAKDGEEAFSKTRDEKPDLLILDIKMNKMNGYEVYERLQSDVFPRGMPIVVVTSLGDEDEKLEALKSRIATVITKPFSPYSVVDKVTELLRTI
ncbi:MAG: response regulator [Proteobacteria bacterium]|nr:response regulator [Pseudomonadota bacterium]NIS70005.1 response regulator [Pseudomonadota bacterium]